MACTFGLLYGRIATLCYYKPKEEIEKTASGGKKTKEVDAAFTVSFPLVAAKLFQGLESPKVTFLP